MTKTEFLKAVQSKVDFEVTQKDLAAIFDAQAKVVREVVLAEDEVTIPEIGKVKVKTVPERTGTVMLGTSKGTTWTKPEHKEATIKITSSLKKIFE